MWRSLHAEGSPVRIQSAFSALATTLLVLDAGAAAGERPEEKKHPALWRVEVGDKYGYVDATGEFVIKPTFRYSLGFSEGLAAFEAGEEHDYRRGYIDATGKVVIEPRFGSADPFHEGRAAVKVDGKCGYIDRTGEYIVRPRFDDAKRFSEGLARVNVAGKADTVHGYAYIRGGKWGYVERTGRIAIEPRFSSAADFSEGLACVSEDDDAGHSRSFGYIDRTGRYVIKQDTARAAYFCSGSFSEGFAHVQVGQKWGFIDKMGRIAISPLFDSAYDFSEGLARVYFREKDLYGYIEGTGEYVIEPRFAEAGDFHEGLARVRLEKTAPGYGRGDRWGFIDRSGKLAIEPRYNEIGVFSNGLAWAHVGGELTREGVPFHSPARWEGGEWLLIDRTGARVWLKEQPRPPKQRSAGVGARVPGKVLAVRPEVNLVMISLGSDHGVGPGLRFWVFRDGKVVTDTEVEHVFKDMSSARVFGGSWRRPPRKGDDVSIARGMYPPSAE